MQATSETTLRERGAAMLAAVRTELDAIARGETTREEAIDRIGERFFPHLIGADRRRREIA